jgi:hypothetical protein
MKTIKINCSRKKSKIQKLSKTMKMIKVPLSFTYLEELWGGGTVDDAEERVVERARESRA